jgi:hypothetical protein
MLVRRQKNINFRIMTLPTIQHLYQTRGRVMADWLYTGVIDGNRAIWTHQTPPLDKTGRAGADMREHSRSKSPVKKIAAAMKRTIGAIRQKALSLGLPLGHRR